MSKPASETPDLFVGDTVYWYPDGDKNQEPQPAIVSKIGFDSICVNIVDPATYNFRIRDGVRYIKDPRARSPETREAGAWDLHPRLKLLLDLERELLEKPKK
jgi:hypothetical protein